MSLPLRTEKEDSFYRPDSPPLCDLLDDVSERIEVDWPEFLPVEGIGVGITGIAFGLLLSAGFVAFAASHLKLQLGTSLGTERKSSAPVLLERAREKSKGDYYTW